MSVDHLVDVNGRHQTDDLKTKSAQEVSPSAFEHQQVSRRQFTENEANIREMIRDCLLTWYEPWKQTFLSNGREYKFVFDLMEGLFYYENQILTSSTPLSVDRTNAIAKAVARLIDCGNAVLNLDLILRSHDDISSEIESAKVTTVELFQAHVKAHKLRRKLLYDYYKKDKSKGLHVPIVSCNDDFHGPTSSSFNGSPHVAVQTPTTLQVPTTVVARGQSPTNDRSLLSVVGSNSSINTMSDGRKSPIGPQGTQIEVLTPANLQSQLEVTHMTASIRSSAFSLNCDSRTRLRLLTEIISNIENLLSSPTNPCKIANCFELLDALLDSLERSPTDSRRSEVQMVASRLLEPIVKKVYVDDRDDQVELQHAHWTASLLSIIRLMTASDFNSYLTHFSNPANLSAFLKDYLFIVKRLSSTGPTSPTSPTSPPIDPELSKNSGCTFPTYWIEMRLLASSTFLASLTHIYHTLKYQYGSNSQIWLGFIDCLLNLLGQDTLRPERFMLRERQTIQAESLRQTAAEYVSAAWDSLVVNHRQLLFEDLIDPLLHATIILRSTQRAILLPIFYDMMRCDYIAQYVIPRTTTGGLNLSQQESYGGSYFSSLCDDDLESLPPLNLNPTNNSSGSMNYSNYQGGSQDGTVLTKFTHLLIGKLNSFLIETELGDESFKNDLCDSLSGKLSSDSQSSRRSMPPDSIQFRSMARHTSDLVAEFIQICLDLQQANKLSYKHLHLLCLFKLILFFRDKVDRPEQYLTNLYKLCILHHNAKRYVEAGYTLYEHSKSLPWSDRPLDSQLRLILRFFHIQAPINDHSSLKVFLYNMMIDYFDQGELWEAAIPLCRELIDHYEFVTFDYEKLGQMHHKLYEFYSNIMQLGRRSNPEYFRVTFFGNGFPACLRNSTMVYRGQPYEKLADFQNSMLSYYSDSKLLTTLAKPDEGLLNNPEARYLQINACSPSVDLNAKFGPKLTQINEAILDYYRHNQCDKFVFSRRFDRPGKGLGAIKAQALDSFAHMWRERTTLTTNTLPGILPFFPVFLAESTIVSPIESAIEDLERTNDRLSSMVNRFKADKRQEEDIRLLGQTLLGIVDAAVNGGIAKYEEAFFGTELFADRKAALSDSPSTGSLTRVNSEVSSTSTLERSAEDRPTQVNGYGANGSHYRAISDNLIDHNDASFPINRNGTGANSSDDTDEVDGIDEDDDEVEEEEPLGDEEDEPSDRLAGLTEHDPAAMPSEAQSDRLKQLIAKQVPLLDEAVRLHRDRVADVMRPQHEHLEASFEKLKQHVVSNYPNHLPSDYMNRLTIRSHRTRNRSPIRFLRSELRLLELTNQSTRDRFMLERLSDVGRRSSAGSNTSDVSTPTISSSFPYRQLETETLPPRAPAHPSPSAGQIDRRLSTPNFGSRANPVAAPRSSSRFKRIQDGDPIGKVGPESIVIQVPPRHWLYSENSTQKNGRDHTSDLFDEAADQSQDDRKLFDSHEAKLVSF